MLGIQTQMDMLNASIMARLQSVAGWLDGGLSMDVSKSTGSLVPYAVETDDSEAIVFDGKIPIMKHVPSSGGINSPLSKTLGSFMLRPGTGFDELESMISSVTMDDRTRVSFSGYADEPPVFATEVPFRIDEEDVTSMLESIQDART